MGDWGRWWYGAKRPFPNFQLRGGGGDWWWLSAPTPSTRPPPKTSSAWNTRPMCSQPRSNPRSPVLPNLQFGSCEYQHFQCEKNPCVTGASLSGSHNPKPPNYIGVSSLRRSEICLPSVMLLGSVFWRRKNKEFLGYGAVPAEIFFPSASRVARWAKRRFFGRWANKRLPSTY